MSSVNTWIYDIISETVWCKNGAGAGESTCTRVLLEKELEKLSEAIIKTCAFALIRNQQNDRINNDLSDYKSKIPFQTAS